MDFNGTASIDAFFVFDGVPGEKGVGDAAVIEAGGDFEDGGAVFAFHGIGHKDT